MPSTDKLPLLSVGFPIYNAEKYLRQSLECILGQTFEDFEVVISDNASTDSTREICEAYLKKDPRIRYFRQEKNLGAPANFNEVFRLSRGKYFKWASYDDLVYPTFLEKCLNALMEREPEGYVACYPKTEVIDTEGKFRSYFEEPQMRVESDNRVHRFHDLAYLVHSALIVYGIIRSDVLAKTCQMGQWLASDYTLAGQLGLHGKVYIYPEYLFMWRTHENTSLASNGYNYYKYARSWVPVSKQNDILFPYWKMAYESARGVCRICPTSSDRLKCLWYVVTCRQRSRGRSQYLWDLIHAIKEFFQRLVPSKH